MNNWLQNIIQEHWVLILSNIASIVGSTFLVLKSSLNEIIVDVYKTKKQNQRLRKSANRQMAKNVQDVLMSFEDSDYEGDGFSSSYQKMKLLKTLRREDPTLHSMLTQFISIQDEYANKVGINYYIESGAVGGEEVWEDPEHLLKPVKAQADAIEVYLHKYLK